MIETKSFFTITCDRCKKELFSQGRKHFETAQEASYYSKDINWLTHGEENYCPDCYYQNGNKEEIRPPIPEQVLDVKRTLEHFYSTDGVVTLTEKEDKFILSYYKTDLRKSLMWTDVKMFKREGVPYFVKVEEIPLTIDGNYITRVVVSFSKQINNCKTD